MFSFHVFPVLLTFSLEVADGIDPWVTLCNWKGHCTQYFLILSRTKFSPSSVSNNSWISKPGFIFQKSLLGGRFFIYLFSA